MMIPQSANDSDVSQDAPPGPKSEDVSPRSKELVIGVVGFAGAGCTTTLDRLGILLETAGYEVKSIKLSDLIKREFQDRTFPSPGTGIHLGPAKFARAEFLQNLGDELRSRYGGHAVASLACKEIIALRGDAQPGERKIAILLDSIKHSDEVKLFWRVYGHSFRLVAAHCEPARREARLIGGPTTMAKYRGVDAALVRRYMDRDEKDRSNKHGQQVRDAFHLADFFIDNNEHTIGGSNLTEDMQRFCNLILGQGLVRPTRAERAINHAYAAARQSSCLSRQVGSALTAEDGTIIATGTNDPPAYGGGVYDEDSSPDHRCSVWEFRDGEFSFKGCHNTRKKIGLRKEIVKWMSENLSDELADVAHPKPAQGLDIAAKARADTKAKFVEIFAKREEAIEDMPGVKELIEYSRAIHAEMDALFSAARKGIPTSGTTLYCTVYPCHNCARHLVTAGVKRVFYVEPYVKSLATELHSDAIATELPARPSDGSSMKQDRMIVVPFTGVGERMYEDFFVKKEDLKDPLGNFTPPVGGIPEAAVRLNNLAAVERAAASLVPERDGG